MTARTPPARSQGPGVHDPAGPQPDEPGTVPMPGGPDEPVTPILPDPSPEPAPQRAA